MEVSRKWTVLKGKIFYIDSIPTIVMPHAVSI